MKMKYVSCALAITAVAIGCGSYGPKGDPGSAGGPGSVTAEGGAPGAPGAPGASGEAGATTLVVLSARAKVGLDISPVPLKLAGLGAADVENVGYGSYLVNTIGHCNDCHRSPDAPSMYLAGGTKFDLAGGKSAYARNLTPGGAGLTEAQFIEAMQTGKDFGNPGQVMVVMPWPYYRWSTKSDLKAMYAYLQAIPAMHNAVAADDKGSLGMAPVVPLPATYNEGEVDPNRPPIPPDGSADPNNVLRGFAIQPLATPPGYGSAPAAAGGTTATVDDQERFATGSYLVNSLGACSSCHTNPSRLNFTGGANYLKINTAGYLSGGQVFTTPPALRSALHQTRAMAQDLTGVNAGYYDPFNAYLAIMVQGIHSLDPQLEAVNSPMPWVAFSGLVSDDLAAIYTYYNGVPRRTGVNDKKTPFNAEFCASDADCTWFPGEHCNVAASECVGTPCTVATDCTNCQTCTTGKCAAPLTSSTCVAQGI
jgi:hypothetical protein